MYNNSQEIDILIMLFFLFEKLGLVYRAITAVHTNLL